ncbi:MAG: putative phosphonate-binding protein [Myxococcales bacterium]|nr:putative phosphonate-binding protein [Myxococcales bacterium]
MASIDTLRFAVSRSNAGSSLLAGARRFAAALGERLALPVEVNVTYDYERLLKALLGGGAELAWMPPLIHARASAAGARLVAVSQRGGLLGYRGAILVRGDSAIADVAQLGGIRAAWVDKVSASGYLVPRLHLIAAARDPATLFASERFYGSTTSACRAVVDRDADVTACFLGGATDRASAQREIAETLRAGPELRVLDVTVRIPPDGFVVAPSLNAPDRSRIRTALLELHTRDDARQALQELLQAERLAPVRDDVVRDLERLVAHAADLP